MTTSYMTNGTLQIVVLNVERLNNVLDQKRLLPSTKTILIQWSVIRRNFLPKFVSLRMKRDLTLPVLMVIT